MAYDGLCSGGFYIQGKVVKLIIAGGRDYVFSDQDYADLWKLHKMLKVTEVVSGRAKGADYYGELWADSAGVPVKPFPADWEKYKRPNGKNPAGAIRNAEMAKYGGQEGAAVLFPGGSGTENMYVQAKKYGLRIFDWRKEPREGLE